MGESDLCLWVSLVFDNYLVLRVCWLCSLCWLGAPGLRGLCRRPRKHPLLWLSCHSREPFLKKLLKTHLLFSISFSLYLLDSFSPCQDSVIACPAYIYILPSVCLLFSLEAQEVDCIQIWRHTEEHSQYIIPLIKFLVCSFPFPAVFCWLRCVLIWDFWWSWCEVFNQAVIGWVVGKFSLVSKQIFCLPRWSLWNLDRSRILFRPMAIMLGEIFYGLLLSEWLLVWCISFPVAEALLVSFLCIIFGWIFCTEM